MKEDIDRAEQYVGSVVMLEGVGYGVILLRIYNNGFLTSGGFVRQIICPDIPVDVAHSQLDILFCNVAGTELPANMFEHKYIFAFDRKVLEDATVFDTKDKLDIAQELKDVDVPKAFVLAAMDNPPVYEVNYNIEDCVYQALDGNWYSWCLMVSTGN